MDGSFALGNVRTLGEVYRRSMAQTSLTLVLLAITGAMALALGLVGIYGVLSYVLTQRTREIGIRMALGAQHAEVRRLMLGHVMALVGLGVVFGLGGAALLTRLMESLLFGVGALDPLVLVSAVVILAVTSFVACMGPARRAVHVSPLVALSRQ